jgi:heme/copper-type cytochrome/quinol oxidase subunit 1
MTCETNKNNELEQTKQPTETTCCCKQFFTTKNICLKVAACVAAIMLAVFVYNEVNRWLAYRSIERVANNFFLTTDRFGWTTISSRMEQDVDNINNKMLLYYIVKQQNEIIKKQSSIDAKLDKLNLPRNEFPALPAPKESKTPVSPAEPNISTTINTPQQGEIQKTVK